MTEHIRQRFAALASLPDDAVDLAEAALLIAAEAEPDLDVSAYMQQLDDLAREAKPRIERGVSGTRRIVELNRFLFVEKGFSGNRKHYYDPRNSLLNHVLDRRTGIPITLTLVYTEVARRIGLTVHGVGFPGHFLAKYAGDTEIIIDAFFGEVLSEEQCEERLQAVLGPQAVFDRRYLEPARPKEILVRMLANLKQVYVSANDFEPALSCADRILLLAPDTPRELRDRGLIYQQLECHQAAVADLERFLQLAPDDPSADALRANLIALRRQATQIH